MTATGLGKLESVELREAWKSEAGDFTPWLAQEDNLKLLGDTIGIELELEAQEKNVGPFRADILCKDTRTGHWVLIENQLELTDHTHLGQLLTYAAGLKAVAIVWIADKFTDEHRAALDWLNEITDERFNFFGLEVELWRIGESPAAPKFNFVSRPNEWTKPPPPGKLTETQQLYLEYWTAFREHLSAKKSPIRVGKPLPQMWMTFPVGRSDFCLSANVSRTKKFMLVQLVIYSHQRLAYLHLLQEQQVEIEAALGPDLEWRELPNGKESHIRRNFNGIDPGNRANWPAQHEKIRETLEMFHKCFSARVKDLDPADHEPEEVESSA